MDSQVGQEWAGADEHGRPSAAHALLRHLREAFASSGMPGALAYLNGRTRFRFTGVYRAEPPLLRNLCLYDRENPRVLSRGEVTELESTFCSVVCGTAAAFATSDAARDQRTRRHPAGERFLSYVGVPIREPGGRVWGTLCHFDPRPRLVPPGEVAALESVSPLIGAWLREREPL